MPNDLDDAVTPVVEFSSPEFLSPAAGPYIDRAVREDFVEQITVQQWTVTAEQG